MIASLTSSSLHGVDAYRIDVEVDISGGLPAYHVVGLAAPSIKEGASRIRSALKVCGQDLPPRKIVVNLAPADRRKDGTTFDLPIAVGIAIADGHFSGELLHGLLLLGELGLDGAVRPVRGALAAAALAKASGLRGVIVPRACAPEAAAVDGIEIYAVDSLADVLRALDGEIPLPRWVGGAPLVASSVHGGDFAEVRGQGHARRAMEIAVAGGHHVLLYGPPGIGKTMLARRVPSILPPMTHDEAVEVTKIYSAAGLSIGKDGAGGLLAERPFRAPHHTCSVAGLIGGGPTLRPGEISLAHRGVLFLDEMPEFARPAIEALRQPLEERCIRISRVLGTVRFPAAFHLVASANPCPCGWRGSSARECTCTAGMVDRYRNRLSGPLLDRIDLQVGVDSLSLAAMRDEQDAESSAVIRERVLAARDRQARRLAAWGVRTNAEMAPAATRATCALSPSAERVLAALFAKRSGFTARGLDRLIRAARTISDLDGVEVISGGAMHEAASYRALEADASGDLRRFLAPAQVG